MEDLSLNIIKCKLNIQELFSSYQIPISVAVLILKDLLNENTEMERNHLQMVLQNKNKENNEEVIESNE